MGRSAPRRGVFLLAGLLAACATETGAPADSEVADPAVEAAERNFPESVYERNLVFITLSGDSALVVPWIFRTRAHADRTVRDIGGWLSRGETWDPFYAFQWESPPTRAPFRIHPHGPVDLIVGSGDALESIIFEDGPRQLETLLDEPLADWSGPRGESVRMHRGAVLLGDRRYEARALDLSRSHAPDQPGGGEWMMLEAGPGLTLVLEAPLETDPPGDRYRAWALLDDEEARWPTVSMTWDDLRPFEEARRDVPLSWRFASEDGELTGSLTSTASSLRAGSGTGAVLPVEGLFRVRGSVEIRGDSMMVRGVVRHIQR